MSIPLTGGTADAYLRPEGTGVNSLIVHVIAGDIAFHAAWKGISNSQLN